MGCLQASGLAVGFEAKVRKELECAVGQQCQRSVETISSGKPTRGLF